MKNMFFIVLFFLTNLGCSQNYTTKIEYPKENNKEIYIKKTYNSKNELIEIEDATFCIIPEFRKGYKGYYKDGKPYNGYFKEDKIIDELYYINYYKKGVLVHRYTSDYLQMAEGVSNENEYTQKTTFEDGKIKTGFDYKLINNSMFVISVYEDFQRKAFYVDTFGMHAFTRVIVQLKGNEIHFDTLPNENKYRFVASKKAGTFILQLYKNGKQVATRNNIVPVSNGSPNSTTIYYKDKNTQKLIIESFKKTVISKEEDEFDHETRMLSFLYFTFPSVTDKNEKQMFEQLFSIFNTESFDVRNIKYWNDSNRSKENISWVSYDDTGKIESGGVVTPNADGTYTLTIHGKEKKTYTKISLDKIKEIMQEGIVVG